MGLNEVRYQRLSRTKMPSWMLGRSKHLEARGSECERRNKDLEDALLLWLKDTRSKLNPVTGPILMEKADSLALKMGIEGFKCSDGWLSRFKARHGIVYRSLCGESGAVSNEACEAWKERFPHLIKDYEPKDIFNADETGLFYKHLPNKTFALKGDPCSGGKQSKLRITVLLASNMDRTEKLKPLVIGKAAKPRCFKGIRSLPVHYFSNKNAWITSDIFTTWLLRLDAQFRQQKRKIILFVDNVSSHVEVDNLEAIKLVFLPANTTARLQPLDQGEIQNLKVNYRRRLLQRVLLCMDTGKDYDITLLSAIHLMFAAWDDVKPETISNCFRHAGMQIKSAEQIPVADSSVPVVDSSVPAADSSVPVVEGVTAVEQENPCPNHEWWAEETFVDYVSVDANLDICGPLNDDEIVRSVHGSASRDSDSDSEPELVKPTEKEVANSLDILRRFLVLEGNDDEIKHLSKIEDFCSRAREARKVQTKITSFFNKS